MVECVRVDAALHLGRHRGLTLVEVIVVVGILGLLMGILLPTLSAVQRSGRATVCMSNMRQLGVAHGLYMNVNRNHLVDAGLPHGGVGQLRSSWLFTLLKIDPGLIDVIRSPADHSRFWAVEDDGSFDGWTLRETLALFEANPNATLGSSQISRWSSYGLNDQLTQYAPALPDPNSETGFRNTNWRRLDRVPRPAATVHFVMMTHGDYSEVSQQFARSDHVHVLDWDSPMAPASVLAANHMQTNAHGGTLGTWSAVANYGFLDGHVASHEFGVVYQNIMENKFVPDYAR